MAARAAFQYRTGAPGMIDVLFGASSFEDFSARLYVFSEIAKQDAELLASLKAQRAEAVELRADLEEAGSRPGRRAATRWPRGSRAFRSRSTRRIAISTR